MGDFEYVYGPVPSRRMGASIGISPIPKGHCNYTCIYCQLGRTRNMTNKRREYFDYKDIIAEFKRYIKNVPSFDVVTIVGEGEPLLYSELKSLIEGIKGLTDKPVAIITNGALLSEPSIREEVKAADIVLPSLDAVDEDMYKKINRPHGKIRFDDYIKGLQSFSKEYEGQLWIETMLIKGVNDNEEFFLSLKELLSTINYHRLYINSPVRPPAESGVEQPDKTTIDKAVSILGGISIDMLVSEGFHSEVKDDYNAVLSIIKRHPMNQFEIKTFIKQRGKTDVKGFLNKLGSDPNVEVVHYKNYYTYRLR